MKWPRQPYPSKQSWTIWKKFQHRHLLHQTKLKPKLCNWYKQCHIRQNWQFVRDNSKVIHTKPTVPQSYSPALIRTRNRTTHTKYITYYSLDKQIHQPAIPASHNKYTLTCKLNTTGIVKHNTNESRSYQFWTATTTIHQHNISKSYYSTYIEHNIVHSECTIKSTSQKTHIKLKSNKQLQPTQLTFNILSIICILTHLVQHIDTSLRRVGNYQTQTTIIKTRHSISKIDLRS
jgi:hypothetical protein